MRQILRKKRDETFAYEFVIFNIPPQEVDLGDYIDFYEYISIINHNVEDNCSSITYDGQNLSVKKINDLYNEMLSGNVRVFMEYEKSLLRM